MRKAIIITSIPIVIFILIVAIYRYYAPPIERVSYSMARHGDTLCIAYIGDSWAFIHQREHQCLIPDIINNHCKRPAKVYSYGLSGRTSKEIYEALFDNKDLKQALQKNKYDYCIVSAGINDANKKMGIRYFQNSMECIIRFLLSNHIRPIILEIPDYDIYKIYRWEGMDRKILRRLSMAINRLPIDCKQIYREALDNLIKERGYQDKVSIIHYKSWNNDYEKDLKTLYLVDGVHLNEYGNHVLDSIIAKEILNNMKYYDHRN